jgi:CRP-like cAMP-binding protein
LRAEPALRDFSQEELDFIAGFKHGELTVEWDGAWRDTALSRGAERHGAVRVSARALMGALSEASFARVRSHLDRFARRAMLGEQLVSVGRRTALERIAFVLLHLFLRAEQLGLTSKSKVQFPFTQQHLADALGMSLVHTNKTLKRLLASKAARWRNRPSKCSTVTRSRPWPDIR